MPAKTTPKRRYNSTRRSRQAAATRQEVLEAAVDLFSETGWSGTTLAAIAERAGVAVETIYNGFGSKKGLLRVACDVAVVGDTQEIPLADRPEYHRMGEGTLDERIQAGVTLQTDIHERSARLWLALTEAAVGDGEVDAWRTELDGRRHLELGRALALVYGQPPDAATIDLVWSLFSPDVYIMLVRDRGLSRAEYEARMIHAVRELGP